MHLVSVWIVKNIWSDIILKTKLYKQKKQARQFCKPFLKIIPISISVATLLQIV